MVKNGDVATDAQGHAVMQESPSTSCVICSPDGNILVWPELSHSLLSKGQQEPLQARISQEVTSISDILTVVHDHSTAVTFAILGAADGRLYRLECSSLGSSAEAGSITPLQQLEVPSSQLLVVNAVSQLFKLHVHSVPTQCEP